MSIRWNAPKETIQENITFVVIVIKYGTAWLFWEYSLHIWVLCRTFRWGRQVYAQHDQMIQSTLFYLSLISINIQTIRGHLRDLRHQTINELSRTQICGYRFNQLIIFCGFPPLLFQWTCLNLTFRIRPIAFSVLIKWLDFEVGHQGQIQRLRELH